MRLLSPLLVLLCCVLSSQVLAAPVEHRDDGYDDVLQLCYSALEAHLCEGVKWGLPFRFYRPSLQKYSPDQWLWDSGAHMIVWSHRNASNSVGELRTLLRMQQPDGFVPEEIFWGARSQIENDELLLQWSNSRHSDITQLPVLPFALRAIHSATSDTALLAEFLPPLVRYMQWWRRTRDDGDGLVQMLHNWEGLDASPAYDAAFHVNVSHVDRSSFLLLYPKFLELTAAYKFEFHWNASSIMNRSRCMPCRPVDRWFQVKDVGLNSVYAAGWGVLQQLALAINDTATAALCAAEAATSARAILSKMSVPRLGGFRSLYVDWDGQEKVSQANVVQNLLPLLLPSLPQQQVAALIAEARPS
jgi:hypothetical protein